MDGFFSWFFAFVTQMFTAFWTSFSNIFLGIFQIFNFPSYLTLLDGYKAGFGIVDWIFCIVGFILVYAFWIIIIALIVVLLRKYIRFRKTLVGNEDLLEEISTLHHEIDRLTKEKERVLALQLNNSGLTADEIANVFDSEGNVKEELLEESEKAEETKEEESKVQALDLEGRRFARLSGVDAKYEYYVAPEYVDNMSLAEICEDLRNFACFRSKLYYDIKIIRLVFAGLASSKMIILQGISGTGKTSLPYIMGKYFEHDMTIASVQPSWRDRAEMFGFFNEFTKKFNETEVLKRMYDATYNDDVNIIVLDEMNIARVEYYFAEMLSILEMPDPEEWKIELVPSTWDNDPKHLVDGKLKIPQNVFYVGTANNDDSTFTISDKVYDRAFTINLDSKGVPFTPEPTTSKNISYSHIAALYQKAWEDYPVTKEMLDNIEKLDLYVIEHFRVAFGNRILKQMKLFVPVYVAAGGTAVEGLDYLLTVKVLRKFETLNMGLIRDEIKGLINYMDVLFGKDAMKECIAYLRRLQKMT